MAKVGYDVSVFTLGGVSYLGLLENAELFVENQTEDGSGVNERWGDPEIVGSNWRFEGENHIETLASIVSEAIGDGLLTFVWNSGANTYTGNVLITTASHQGNRRAMQKERWTAQGKSTPVVS